MHLCLCACIYIYTLFSLYLPYTKEMYIICIAIPTVGRLIFLYLIACKTGLSVTEANMPVSHLLIIFPMSSICSSA